jgi:putative SOS response-associated peptidase YedK
MCGRFTLTAEPGAVAGHFQAVLRFPVAGPRYNIAPGQDIAAVVSEAHGRQLVPLRWGLVPHWVRAGTRATGHPLINARAETVSQKPAFRDAFWHRRCLVPADGYYEWQKTAGGKIPYRIVCREAGLFTLAGIWNPGQAEGAPCTCAILTTPASGKMQEIHDRMPLILTSGAEYARWLEDKGPPLDLLRTYPGECRAYWVSTAVNSSRFDSPELIAPLGRA